MVSCNSETQQQSQRNQAQEGCSKQSWTRARDAAVTHPKHREEEQCYCHSRVTDRDLREKMALLPPDGFKTVTCVEASFTLDSKVLSGTIDWVKKFINFLHAGCQDAEKENKLIFSDFPRRKQDCVPSLPQGIPPKCSEICFCTMWVQ